MNKQMERENYLLGLLSGTNRISTSEGVKLLGVSDATARRIFARMEKTGKIIRDYGGIQLVRQGLAYSFDENANFAKPEKQRIGRMAASFVEDGESIYLDCGTTVFQMALALNERILSGELKSLNIVTNSIANINAITKPASGHIILIGGEFDKNRKDFSGPLTEKFVALFHFNRSFFGCDGLDEKMGFTSNQIEISSLNALVIRQTDHPLCLLDSSKYGKRSLITYAGVTGMGAVVSDLPPPPALQKILADAGVRISVAPVTPGEGNAQEAG